MFVANWERSRYWKCSEREMRVVQNWNPNLHGNLSDDHLFCKPCKRRTNRAERYIECSCCSALLWNVKKAIFSTVVFQEPILRQWPFTWPISERDKFGNGWRLYVAITQNRNVRAYERQVFPFDRTCENGWIRNIQRNIRQEADIYVSLCIWEPIFCYIFMRKNLFRQIRILWDCRSNID